MKFNFTSALVVGLLTSQTQSIRITQNCPDHTTALKGILRTLAGETGCGCNSGYSGCNHAVAAAPAPAYSNNGGEASMSRRELEDIVAKKTSSAISKALKKINKKQEKAEEARKTEEAIKKVEETVKHASDVAAQKEDLKKIEATVKHSEEKAEHQKEK